MYSRYCGEQHISLSDWETYPRKNLSQICIKEHIPIKQLSSGGLLICTFNLYVLSQRLFAKIVTSFDTEYCVYLKVNFVLKTACPCRPVPCLINKWL